MASGKKVKKIIRIDKEENSGLSAFVERPVPTENEVENFERVVGQEIRHQEIDSKLTEIYSDKKGALINVKKMTVKRQQIFMIKILKQLFTVVLLALAAYFSYFYFFNRGNDMSGLEFSIVAPDNIKAGEEFSYQIKYDNPTKFPLANIRLELQYPDNFIFSSASLTPSSGNYGFSLPDLASGASGSLLVSGKMISPADSVNVISGRLTYIPSNFSSEFKKESSAATVVSGIGFQVGVEASNTAFLGQNNEINISFFQVDDNQLGDFNIKFILPGDGVTSFNDVNQSATSSAIASTSSSTRLQIVGEGANTWLVSGLSVENSNQKLAFNYLFKNQPDKTDIVIRLEKKLADGQTYVFWEKTLSPEIVKSDLNLTLFLNGSKNNGAASFGDTLNYTLNYSNKGANSFKDAVIMAVVDGYFLDLSSIHADKNGETQNGKIVWTKQALPALAEIKPGDEGEINFSVKLKNYQESDFGNKLEISAYSQYGIDNKNAAENNKSNIIVTKLNSDLVLAEQVRYFDDDNAPVGSGPLPPKVGEKSSFKVYWTVKNNLHELSATSVILNLPAQVSWDNSVSAGVGNLYYDSSRHAVVWDIGRLPVSVYQVDASFSISVIPNSADQDKILILSPGSVITALDNETQSTITKKTSAKTTKLEDDDIAGLNNSGRVSQ
ncbi:MAG: hypothetical protein WCW61_01525 [Patescibacteria group bacterium]